MRYTILGENLDLIVIKSFSTGYKVGDRVIGHLMKESHPPYKKIYQVDHFLVGDNMVMEFIEYRDKVISELI